MQLPQNNIIEKVVLVARESLADQKLEHQVNQDCCVLSTNDRSDLKLLRLLRILRKQFKNLYFWIDSKIVGDHEESSLKFTLKVTAT